MKRFYSHRHVPSPLLQFTGSVTPYLHCKTDHQIITRALVAQHPLGAALLTPSLKAWQDVVEIYRSRPTILRDYVGVFFEQCLLLHIDSKVWRGCVTAEKEKHVVHKSNSAYSFDVRSRKDIQEKPWRDGFHLVFDYNKKNLALNRLSFGWLQEVDRNVRKRKRGDEVAELRKETEERQLITLFERGNDKKEAGRK